MKVQIIFVNRNADLYSPVVVSIMKGRYGSYSQVRGINRSEKVMMEMGYSIEQLTRDEIIALNTAHRAAKDAQDKLFHDKKMQERFESVAACLTSTPVEVIENNGGNTFVSMVANLSGTEMINQYAGCGKGTAYLINDKVVAFHYGYEQPSNAPESAIAVRIEFSCTQICF